MEDLNNAKTQVKKEIIEAYVFLREHNMSIPSDTLEFMKDASLKAINNIELIAEIKKQSNLVYALAHMSDMHIDNVAEVSDLDTLIEKL